MSQNFKLKDTIFQFKQDPDSGPRPVYLLHTGKVAASPNRVWNLHNRKTVTAD